MRSGPTLLLGAFLFVQNPQAPPPPPMTVDKIAEDFGWDATGNPLRNVLDGLMAELKP